MYVCLFLRQGRESFAIYTIYTEAQRRFSLLQKIFNDQASGCIDPSYKAAHICERLRSGSYRYRTHLLA